MVRSHTTAKPLIITTLLYGSKYWILLNEGMDKLEISQIRCLCQILGVSLVNRLKNTCVHQCCSTKPTTPTPIHQNELRLCGQVYKIEAGCFAKNLLLETQHARSCLSTCLKRQYQILPFSLDALKSYRCFLWSAPAQTAETCSHHSWQSVWIGKRLNAMEANLLWNPCCDTARCYVKYVIAIMK